MRRINSSTAALGMSGAALFIALGGTAVAVSQIGTSQIKTHAVTGSKLANGAVTASKVKNGAVSNAKLANGAVNSSKLATAAVATTQLANGAVTATKLAPASVSTTDLADASVTTSKLADNSVTSAKVVDGSLTASDVAPNTFLAADGTAANSSELGGAPARSFVTGGGRMVSGRISISAGQGPVTLLELDFGHIDVACLSGSVPELSFTAELPVQNLIDWTTDFGGAANIQTTNAATPGVPIPAPHTANPQSVTWQVAYNDGTTQQMATAWTTGQNISGGCVFTGQGFTTL